MTDDRVTRIERRMDILLEEHVHQKEMLDGVANSVHSILQQIGIMAASLAAHSTIEADHHASRSKLLIRLIVGLAGILAMLTAIHAIVTGSSIYASIIPMMKSLLGL